MKDLFTRTIAAVLTAAVILTGTSISALAADTSTRTAKPAATTEQAGTRTTDTVTGSTITGSQITVAGSKVSSLKQSDRSVKITVSKSGSGQVSGYEIDRKTGTGKWSKIATKTGSGKVTYTDKDVFYNRSYSYRARAYYEDKGVKHYGKYSPAASIKVTLTLAKATISSSMPGRLSVKLAISHAKGGKITGYYLYKKDSKGVWRNKAIIKKGGKVTYEDKNVSYKKTYQYRVRSYYKDSAGKIYKGTYSKTVKVKVSIYAQKKHVTDKKSPLYGKNLIIYRYGDGSIVDDVTKYVKIKPSGYELYVNKSKDFVTAYAIQGKYLIPVKSFICSPGNATPVGTHKIILKYRWHELMGPCWGQWCSKVVSNGIYFHSIFSSKPNSNNTMSVRAYNKLGTTCSHGCIRVQAGTAKWIYDNCKVGTKVVIHTKNGYEPLKKPSIGKLPSWHTWDPTDPTAQKYCKAHKCHKYSKK